MRRRKGYPPFNLVLSDAMHTTSALEVESLQLMRHGLIGGVDAGHVSMMWDDCEGPLQNSVEERSA